MLLQKKNKSIMEIRKKDKKIYERGNCSLKFFFNLFIPEKKERKFISRFAKNFQKKFFCKSIF